MYKTDLDRLITRIQLQPLWPDEDSRGNPVLNTKPIVFTSSKPPFSLFRRISTNIAQSELHWMLTGSGCGNGREAHVTDEVEKIWSPWDGDMGPMYGVQWRKWLGHKNLIDQVQNTIDLLRRDPKTRRAVISNWSVHEVDKMKLPPCPITYTFNTYGGRLNLSVSARSTDIICGLPYDLMHGYMFMWLMAKSVYMPRGDLTFFSASPHIYEAHSDLFRRWANFHPINQSVEPKLFLKSDISIENFTGKEFFDHWNTAPVRHAQVVV